MSSLPMYFPNGFDMDVAKTCAQLTQNAFEMYTQWTEQGKPRKEAKFNWTQPSGTGLSFFISHLEHQKDVDLCE